MYEYLYYCLMSCMGRWIAELDALHRLFAAIPELQLVGYTNDLGRKIDLQQKDRDGVEMAALRRTQA